ncbi:MAG TPA: hypothetical protein VF824_20660 [Thermoanaerobaculia bacterium]|jgi:hypothetical protein
MSTLGYVDVLRLLDEVNRIGQTQTLKIVLDSIAGASPRVETETAAAGAPVNAATPTFDVIRTQSLLYEETQRLRNVLLQRLHEIHRGAAPAPPPPPVAPEPGEWTDADILELLNDAQMALLKHPTAAQAAFAALVREGRRYAETESGKKWLEVLGASDLMRRARWVWETTSLNMLEEDAETIVPSTYLEALLRAADALSMEDLLGKVKGMGHE